MEEQVLCDSRAWAHSIIGTVELGDARRVRTAEAVLEMLADGAGSSLPGMCEGRPSAYERIARFSRSSHVSPMELCRAGCSATIAKMRDTTGDLVVVQDTTTLSYPHASIANEVHDLGGPENQQGQGFHVHSSLVVHGETGVPIGLLAQEYGVREPEGRGKKHARRERLYEEKESFKWEVGFRASHEAAYSELARMVFVSDRESDVHLYMLTLMDEGARFVVRNAQDRRLDGEAARLHETAGSAPVLGKVELFIAQRGGRPARTARLEVRARKVVLRAPSHSMEELPSVPVNAVLLREIDRPADQEPVEWLLLTREPIETLEQCVNVIKYYTLRWTIEEFHRCWKSDGTNVESLRLQTADNLLRIAIPMAFVAIRIMCLRDGFLRDQQVRHQPVLVGRPAPKPATSSPIPCTHYLTTLQWQFLWVWAHRDKPLPQEPPTTDWAMRKIAAMGGWMDTKRTGIPGYKTLWVGWRKLQIRIEAVQLGESLQTAHPEVYGEK